jgi:hypothetical protein
VKNIKKLVVALILPLTLLGSYAAKADSLPGEQFVISNPPTNDRYTGVNLADSQDAKNTYSSLEAFTANGTSGESSILTRTPCQKVGDPGCEPSKYFQYNAQLGMCDSNTTTDCVTSVEATDDSGKTFVGKYVEDFPGKSTFSYPGDPSLNLPPGSSTFIVDFPDLPHAGGTKYLVVAFMQGARGFSESKFHSENFAVGIFAVSKVAGQFSVTRPETTIRPDHQLRGRQALKGGFGRFASNPTGDWGMTACVQTSYSECLLAWTLPNNVSFSMSLKLHEKITGWLHGRLGDAQSIISTAPDGDQLISIQGKPSLVPGIYGWFKKSQYPPLLKTLAAQSNGSQWDTNGLGWPSADGVTNNGPDGLPYSIIRTSFGYDTGSFKEVLAWIGSLGDKAAYAQTVWSARTIQSGEFGNCIKGTDSLSGIVSTNSTMYVGNPPTFNKTDQTLDYKVVSPHYLPDGSEFKGSYDLVIRSDVARCIYGFTSAPISATISVVSANGTAQIATTVFNERDGWIRLAARNFTFSSPTVKVQFTQAGSKSAESGAAAPKSASPAKPQVKKTIICVKGNISKKISGEFAACPVGYKKK